MREKIRKHLVCLLVLSLLMSFMPVAAVEASTTVKGYTINKGNTTVYKKNNLKEKYGAIYDSDEVTVLEVNNKYLKVKYPISGGKTKTGYIKRSAMLLNTSGTCYRAGEKYTTYKRPDGEVYGYISNGDIVEVLGVTGNWIQVKYPVSGGYKYAFIAKTDNTIKGKLDKLVSQYVNKRSWPSKYGAQCYSFAHFVFNDLFGRDRVVGTYNRGTEYIFSNLSSDIKNIGTLKPGYKKSSLNTLLKKAAPGDYLQTKRRTSGGPHSMIVYSIDKKNNKITIFDANTDGKNTVKKYTQSFNEFYQKNQGVSLYRYKNYNP